MADGEGEKRIEIVVKETRIGKLATYSDKESKAGIRSMTDAEHEAHDFVSDVIERIDAEAHESGDRVAEVVVDEDGECSVEWSDEAVLKDNYS